MNKAIKVALTSGVALATSMVGNFDSEAQAQTTTTVATSSSASCAGLPSFATLRTALRGAVAVGNQSVNGGLANNMWATVVNRDGLVCAVAFSGSDRNSQWLGSRVISAQKANTANAFSLTAGQGGIAPGLALSTGNLFTLVQDGKPLFGLQFSNPVDPQVAYAGPAQNFGTTSDPLVGKAIGGVNVFGGGLGLYDSRGKLLGGLGVSGDTACTDHIVAWKVRDALALDVVPTGISVTSDDNLVLLTDNPTSSFGHPSCGFAEDPIIRGLPTSNPVARPR